MQLDNHQLNRSNKNALATWTKDIISFSRYCFNTNNRLMMTFRARN